MVKLVAPLRSCAASGTLAGTLIYSTSRGTAYVRKHSVPSDPATQLQLTGRFMLAFLSQIWKTLPTPERLTWTDYAASLTLSSYHAFNKYNLARFSDFRTPSMEHPATDEYINPRAMSCPVTGGEGKATITINRHPLSCPWGWLIFRHSDELYVPSPKTLIMVVPHPGPQTFDLEDSPLDPGRYRWMHMQFFGNGFSETNVRYGWAIVT